MATYVAMRQAADGPEGWLWPSPRGGHLRRNNHSRWWLPVRRAAGWADDWTWHSLRHLFAVTALAPAAQGGWGMSLEDVSQLLGHHAADFTSRRYLSVRANHITRAADTARAATRPALAPPPEEPSQYLRPRRAR
jgi:integrase